jgi:hypothetical protein
MASNASACSFNAWGQGSPAGGGTVASGGVGTILIAGSPPAVSRYSGVCGSQSTVAGNYVQDGLPGAEQNYRVRFYVLTGLSAGSATVFKALSNVPATAIQVDYDATAGNFNFTTLGGSTWVGSIVSNKWYAIELQLGQRRDDGHQRPG